MKVQEPTYESKRDDTKVKSKWKLIKALFRRKKL